MWSQPHEIVRELNYNRTHTHTHTHTYIYIYIYIYAHTHTHTLTHTQLPSRLGLENTPTASLQRDKTPPKECPRYDTKQSDDEVPVMLRL